MIFWLINHIKIIYSLLYNCRLAGRRHFAEYPFLQIYTLYNSWIGGRANETLPMVFFYTMPVFVVIPYSWSYLAEEKNGYDRIMASQLGKASYFLGKYVSTFLSGALTVLLPMLFSFLLASCLVPAYRPDINFALYYQVSATKLLGNLYYAHPLCTAFLNMLMIGIFAGAWATIPFALSFFEKINLWFFCTISCTAVYHRIFAKSIRIPLIYRNLCSKLHLDDQFIIQSIYRSLCDYDGITHSSAARYCFGKGKRRRCLLNFWITICATA